MAAGDVAADELMDIRKGGLTGRARDIYRERATERGGRYRKRGLWGVSSVEDTERTAAEDTAADDAVDSRWGMSYLKWIAELYFFKKLHADCQVEKALKVCHQNMQDVIFCHVPYWAFFKQS